MIIDFHFIIGLLILIGNLVKTLLKRGLKIIFDIVIFIGSFVKDIGRFCQKGLIQIASLLRSPIPRERRLSTIFGQNLRRLRERVYFKTELNFPRLSSTAKYFFLGILFTFCFFFVPFQIHSLLITLPHPKVLGLGIAPVTTKIYDRNGLLLYEVYLDENRTPVSLNQVPKHLKEATLSIEDSEFYSHLGFSVKGILRSLKKLVFEKKIEGGSTITQQLVRSALLTPERTLSRKIKEIVLAFWAERLYSKDKILEMYLNQVPYGGSAWGVESAAHLYFDKSVSELSLAESALLAGLPAAPSRFSPLGHYPQKAFGRQSEVLRRMVEEGFVSQKEAEKAKNESLAFAPQRTSIHAPHFVMYVKSLLIEKYGQKLVEQGGLRVVVSLDLPLQEEVEEIVKNEILKLSSLKVSNGAVLITNPRTGEILSMIGSKDYFNIGKEGNVNVTLSLQQPGSAIKVVTYAAALQNGFTAATVLNDTPVTYKLPYQPPYSPINYDRRFHGKVPLRYALGNSYNVPAVKTLAKIGLDLMIEQGRKMGIESWENQSRYGLSLTLGGGEVTMLDMARVYGTLANKGVKQELNPILEVTDYNGRTLEESFSKNGTKTIPEEVAFILTDILSDNRARTAAFGPNSLLNIPGQKVAVKTGTSNDLRDNWAIGFTPSYTVTVWVGNNDNSPMSRVASGITGATPIWREIMEILLAGEENKEFAIPQGVTKISCRGREEYFIKGTEPAGGCPPLPTRRPSPTPTPSQTAFIPLGQSWAQTPQPQHKSGLIL